MFIKRDRKFIMDTDVKEFILDTDIRERISREFADIKVNNH